MTNTAFSWESRSARFTKEWSAVSPDPLQCLFMNEPPLSCPPSCPAENTQLSAENTRAKALPSGLRSGVRCLPGAPPKPLPKTHTQKTVLQKGDLAHAPGSGYSFPTPTPILGTAATTHIFTSTSGHLHACRILGPCYVSSDYLFFWDWRDGEELGGQYSAEAEKHYFSSFFWQCVFRTFPSTALYPSCVYVIKGGEVCFHD